MHSKIDLSLFSRQQLALQNYIFLPRVMRRKLTYDLFYSVSPRLKSLKEILPLENDTSLRSLIQKHLSQHGLEKVFSTDPILNSERKDQLIGLLHSPEYRLQRRAFRFAANHPSEEWLEPMKLEIEKTGDPHFIVCYTKVLQSTKSKATWELVDLLKFSNPLVYKTIIQNLEEEECLAARDVFLTLLKSPVNQSKAIYQTYKEAINRIPLSTRLLCWAQTVESSRQNQKIRSNLQILSMEFPELSTLLQNSSFTETEETPERAIEKSPGFSPISNTDKEIELFLERLGNAEESLEYSDILKLREIISHQAADHLLNKAIPLLVEHTEGDEWTTLSPLLSHKDLSIRTDAGIGLMNLKDKRIIKVLIHHIFNEEIPEENKYRWLHSGFKLALSADEKEGIRILLEILNWGPNSEKILENCLQQWKSPSPQGLQFYIRSLKTRTIKNHHGRPLYRFFLGQRPRVKKCRLDVDVQTLELERFYELSERLALLRRKYASSSEIPVYLEVLNQMKGRVIRLKNLIRKLLLP